LFEHAHRQVECTQSLAELGQQERILACSAAKLKNIVVAPIGKSLSGYNLIEIACQIAIRIVRDGPIRIGVLNVHVVQ